MSHTTPVGRKPTFAKPKKIKKSTVKKKAWAAFSQYMRLKYADHRGYDTCYTCGKQALWKSMQAGHGIGGRNNSILFEERLVKPQCVGCNVFGRGQYRVFTRKLIAELGLDQYDELVTQSTKLVKLTPEHLENLYKHYKSLVDNFTLKEAL